MISAERQRSLTVSYIQAVDRWFRRCLFKKNKHESPFHARTLATAWINQIIKTLSGGLIIQHLSRVTKRWTLAAATALVIATAVYNRLQLVPVMSAMATVPGPHLTRSKSGGWVLASQIENNIRVPPLKWKGGGLRMIAKSSEVPGGCVEYWVGTKTSSSDSLSMALAVFRERRPMGCKAWRSSSNFTTHSFQETYRPSGRCVVPTHTPMMIYG